MDEFTTDNKGRLLVNKLTLLQNDFYTETSYRSGKTRNRFEEVQLNADRYVVLGSLPPATRERILAKFEHIRNQYTQALLATEAAGGDCVPLAVNFTADTLQINEAFIRSGLETFINTRYTMFLDAYIDLGLHSDSMKGYARQCALVQWLHEFVKRINASEPNMRVASLRLRSFRMNVLTAISSMKFEVKIPTSEARFNEWFDNALSQMNGGKQPTEIITIKRKGNSNPGKITEEQIKIAEYWHKNGTNMSVPTVYKKWLEYAKQKGWWLKDGVFCPPTEGRLYQLLQEVKNPMLHSRIDGMKHRALVVPAVLRSLPAMINEIWVLDGTAHNENVHDNRTVRQHVYVIKVVDVASYRLLGATPVVGNKEDFSTVLSAIIMAIRISGYKPAAIQSDRGPAYKQLQAWCESESIRFQLAAAGNARSKTIENMFYQFDNDITRFLDGYSGQNLTAVNSVSSKPSEKRERQGKSNARSASLAMEWIQNDGINLWNERVIETLNHAPCNKTPYELWDSKESFTPKLSHTQLSVMCGTQHNRKLTVEGIVVEHNKIKYIYFPPIETPEQREMAEQIYTNTPIDKHNDNQLSIYILDGGKPAPVFNKEGKYLGTWQLKQSTGYTAAANGTDSEKEILNNQLALQSRVIEKAKELNKEIDNYVERLPDYDEIEKLGKEALTGKRRQYKNRYDKTELLETEADYKATESKLVYKNLVDPDTGEIHRVLVKDN